MTGEKLRQQRSIEHPPRRHVQRTADEHRLQPHGPSAGDVRPDAVADSENPVFRDRAAEQLADDGKSFVVDRSVSFPA